MNIPLLREIVVVQKFVHPEIHARYFSGLTRFEKEFDKNEELLQLYTKHLFTETQGNIILELYKESNK